jgi:2-keto-4-pentenoate hydratase
MKSDSMNHIDRLAASLIGAHRSGKRVALPVGTDAPQSLGEAYHVQAAVAAGLGKLVGGYKIGLAPDGSAIFAPIYGSEIIETGGTYAARPFDRVGIELEFAFRFARQVPAKASRDEILKAIDRAFVAIELCETRYPTHEGVERATALADNQFNRGLVVGTEFDFKSGHGRDFKGAASRWLLDGAVSHEKAASHPNGDPLAPLAVLPSILAEQERAIEPGQIVITGSLNGITWAKPGLRVEGQIDGFGTVSVTVTP